MLVIMIRTIIMMRVIIMIRTTITSAIVNLMILIMKIK